MEPLAWNQDWRGSGTWPCDFDDPEAQPFEQGGDSGDDWQLVDAASSMLPDGSISVVDLVHRADGMEHVKHEEYINAPSFGGAKQGYVYGTGGSGLGYYWDDRKALSFQKAAVLSQWLAYLKGLGDMAPGWCKDLERAEQFKWTVSLADAIDGGEGTGRTRVSRRRPKRRKRHGIKGQDMENVPEFVDTEDDSHRKGARWWAFDTCNPNCSEAVAYLGRSQADFCLVQEFREADTMAIQAKQRAATRKGWGLAVTPAVCTAKGGISAGVGIAARSACGMVERMILENFLRVLRGVLLRAMWVRCAEEDFTFCQFTCGTRFTADSRPGHIQTAWSVAFGRGFQHHSPGAVCFWLVTTGSWPCPCSSGPYLRQEDV